MSHMVAQVNAYDVMGDVFVHATITDHDMSQADEERTHTWTLTFQGTGEARPGKWVRDVLQELLEQL